MNKLRIPFLFAFRYLFSKKSVNAINIISLISFIGVLVSTAALVIVLSFYNGMERFILSMYSNFTPDLRIEPLEGKFFATNRPEFQRLASNPFVQNYSEIIEDKILIQYDGQQFIGNIKGITPASFQLLRQEEMLQSGKFSIDENAVPYALIGAQIQANLRIPLSDYSNNMELYFPRKGASIHNINPLEDFNIRQIGVNGILTYQPEFDNLLMVPMNFARELLGEQDKVSAIELYLSDPAQASALQKSLLQDLKDSFSIKNREQQNPTLYKTIKSEKWIVFFILTFIGIIAIFNIVGSLTMLVIDKKEDMKVLQYLGAEAATIEKIFLIEGLLIAVFGALFGIVVGYIFCQLQEAYGFIRTGEMEGSLIDVYPVDVRWLDFVLVFFTVFILSSIVAFFSSKLSVREIGKAASPISGS